MHTLAATVFFFFDRSVILFRNKQGSRLSMRGALWYSYIINLAVVMNLSRPCYLDFTSGYQIKTGNLQCGFTQEVTELSVAFCIQESNKYWVALHSGTETFIQPASNISEEKSGFEQIDTNNSVGTHAMYMEIKLSYIPENQIIFRK